jgi:hypothetical protein
MPKRTHLQPKRVLVAERSDIYGTAWGQVLADVDPRALSVAGLQTIAFPDGIPDAG